MAEDDGNGKAKPTPDRELILQHLELIFPGGDDLHDGLVEIAHGRDGPHSAHLFGVDDLGEAADYAVRVNAAGHHVYVGMAARKPGTPVGKRAGREHAYGARCTWADADDRAAVDRAVAAYRAAGCGPDIVVVTGTVPSTRAQFAWLLDDAVTDLDRLERALAAIADALGTDRVTDAPRVMRLAGTVNWARRPDRVDELVTLRWRNGEGSHTDWLALWRAYVESRPAPPGRSQEAQGAPSAADGDLPRSAAGQVDLAACCALAARPGRWHDVVLRVVAHLAGLGRPDDEVLFLCRAFTQPGWTAEQTDRNVRVMLQGCRAKGWQPAEPVRVEDVHVEPRPGKERRVDPGPPLDDPMFRGPLGDAVRVLDPLTEASRVAVLASLITMHGNVMGRSWVLKVGADQHFPGMITLLVGPSGVGRKGTAAGLAELVERQVDEEWADNNVRRQINSGEGITKTARRIDEAAHERCGRGDRRLMFIVDEWVETIVRAKRQGATIFGALRDVWDGRPIDNTSIGNYVAPLKDMAVSVLGMTTWEDFIGEMPLREFATGTMNRATLLRVDRSKVILGHPPDIDAGVVRGPVAALRDGLVKAGGLFKSGNSCKQVGMSDRALELAAHLRRRYEPPTDSWVDRATERAYLQALRAALVYAVADGSRQVEEEHLASAASLVDLAHAGVKMSAEDAVTDPNAVRLLKWLRAYPGEAYTRTQIHTECFHKALSAERIQVAITELERLGFVAEGVVQPSKGTTGGRPKIVCRLA